MKNVQIKNVILEQKLKDGNIRYTMCFRSQYGDFSFRLLHTKGEF